MAQKPRVKIVSISKEFFQLCSFDKELLKVDSEYGVRPHIVVIKLKYRGKDLMFSLPIRSNIPPTVKSENYIGLPPNAKTRPNHRHGIHLEKMFPIEKKYKVIYNSNDFFSRIIVPKIQRDFKEIVQKAQNYLDNYEKGIKTPYSTNIDLICEALDIKF